MDPAGEMPEISGKSQAKGVPVRPQSVFFFIGSLSVLRSFFGVDFVFPRFTGCSQLFFWDWLLAGLYSGYISSTALF